MNFKSLMEKLKNYDLKVQELREKNSLLEGSLEDRKKIKEKH